MVDSLPHRCVLIAAICFLVVCVPVACGRCAGYLLVVAFDIALAGTILPLLAMVYTPTYVSVSSSLIHAPGSTCRVPDATLNRAEFTGHRNKFTLSASLRSLPVALQ